MATVIMAIPIFPGKTEEYRAFLTEMGTNRRAEYLASRRRMGITSEKVWVQTTAVGDVAILQVEAPDFGPVFRGIATSTDPFDDWFRKQEGELIDVMKGPMPSAMPDLAFSEDVSAEGD